MNALSFTEKRARGLSSKRKTPATVLIQGVKARRRAFTLIELLVVIAIIAILAAIMLPVLNAAKLRAQGINCVNNLREIMIAFKMYDNEDNDFFPINLREGQYNDDGSSWSAPWMNWVAGDERYDGTPDNTNEALLVDSHYSQLASFQPNPLAYHCPADQSKSGPVGGNDGMVGPPRVRSYSMSLAVGCSNLLGGPAADPLPILGANDTAIQWTYFNKESMLHGGMGPSDLWVLIDENPDSIDDGNFAFTMPYKRVMNWYNCPSKLHGSRTGIAFEDGHAEIHRWIMPGEITATTYLHYGNNPQPPVPGGDPDIEWMAAHTSIPVPGQNLN